MPIFRASANSLLVAQPLHEMEEDEDEYYNDDDEDQAITMPMPAKSE
jgi:hypothetical protein